MFGVARCTVRGSAQLRLNIRSQFVLKKNLPAITSSHAVHVLSAVTPKVSTNTNHTMMPPSTMSALCYSTDVAEPIDKRIRRLVKENKIVVFMKGTPEAPRCGFSNAVMQILRMHGVKDFQSHNVLEDDDLRQGIKEFSNWPTIPQVYIDGEFIGGCDIMIEMHQKGELIEELNKVGIRSALLDKQAPDTSH